MFPTRNLRRKKNPEARCGVARAIGSCLIAASLVALAGCQSSRNPVVQPDPPRSEVSTTEVSSDELAARLGLQARWAVPGSVLVMEGPPGTLRFEVGRRECMVNGLKVFLGEPPRVKTGRILFAGTDLDHLLRPILLGDGVRGREPVRTVALDAGHGGQDSGTRNPGLGLEEKELTLDLARRLATILGDRGYTVIMTRTDDTFVALDQRPRLARGADLFLSIHFNATANPAVTGTETYLLSKPGQASTGVSLPYSGDTSAQSGNFWDAPSASFGFDVQQRLVGTFGTVDRGLKYARFAVLRDLPCPGILVESAFLSNRAEASRVADPAFRQQLAQALADGVDAYAARAAGSPR